MMWTEKSARPFGLEHNEIEKMRLTPQEQRITDIAAPVIEDLGFALVSVKIIGEGGSINVQIMAEDSATGRLGVDDCAKISRALSATFDVEDPIKGAYRLEISSPGIDRPLTREQDFATYNGFEAKVETETPNENGQRRFRGRINNIENGLISMTTDQGEAEIPFATLTKAKLVLTEELIKQTATNNH